MRIHEPFIKGHLALWIAGKGGAKIEVSVDGAEPNPGEIRAILQRAGYSHEPAKSSKVSWTGRYGNGDSEILVVSRPGFDLAATLPDDSRVVAECKGEPTASAIKAGRDRLAFQAAIGQLILATGNSAGPPNSMILAVPNTKRFLALAREASTNRWLQALKTTVVLISAEGEVSEV